MPKHLDLVESLLEMVGSLKIGSYQQKTVVDTNTVEEICIFLTNTKMAVVILGRILLELRQFTFSSVIFYYCLVTRCTLPVTRGATAAHVLLDLFHGPAGPLVVVPLVDHVHEHLPDRTAVATQDVDDDI